MVTAFRYVNIGRFIWLNFQTHNEYSLISIPAVCENSWSLKLKFGIVGVKGIPTDV